MAGGGKIQIKGGVASKNEAQVVDGALLVTAVGGVGAAARFQMNFYGENAGGGVTEVELMEENVALGIPLARAVQSGNVAVRFRRDAGAPPGDWTLRLFMNDVEVATFAVTTT